MQGSIGSSLGCMLYSLLAFWASRLCIILGSHCCYPWLFLIFLTPSTWSKSTKLSLLWLVHNDWCLWRNRWLTRFPPSVVTSILYIFILSMIMHYIWTSWLSRSTWSRSLSLLSNLLALTMSKVLLFALSIMSTRSWASWYLSYQCSVFGQLKDLTDSLGPFMGNKDCLILRQHLDKHL